MFDDIHVEPHQADKNKPKWIWKIDSSKLETPIIHPTDCDWQIRWRKGNVDNKKSKVKYFSRSQIKFGNFLILRDLLNIKH